MKLIQRGNLVVIRHWFKWYVPDLMNYKLYRLAISDKTVEESKNDET